MVGRTCPSSMNVRSSSGLSQLVFYNAAETNSWESVIFSSLKRRNMAHTLCTSENENPADVAKKSSELNLAGSKPPPEPGPTYQGARSRRH
jgi:hypothetical protein